MKLPDRLRRINTELSRLQIPVYAGNAAFFLLLSAFPLAILLLALLPELPATQADLWALLRPLAPEPLLPLFAGWLAELEGGGSPALFSASALALAWSGSKGMLSILSGLNAIYGAQKRRGFLARRALCLLCTLLALSGLVLALLLRGLGRVRGVSEAVPLDSALLLTVLFLALYRYLPDERQRLGRVWPGALAAAVCWLVFARLFSIYVNLLGGFSSLYGGLAILLLALLWLYGSVCIVFLGAFFGRALRRR